MSLLDALSVIAKPDTFDESIEAFVAVRPDIITKSATIELDYGNRFERYLIEIVPEDEIA